MADDSASSRGVSRGGNGAVGRNSGDRSNRSRESGGTGPSRSSGGLSGALRGAVKGAAYGSMLGGPGAMVGGLAGALMGGLSGGMGGMGSSAARGGALSGAGHGADGGAGDAAGRTILGRRASAAPGTIASALKKFTRPGNATPPGWMRFEPVMSDIQRRSYIATQGLSGDQGLYRSGEAKDYYKNLLGQNFISPLGQAQGDLGQLLPIEQQYLMALGIPEFKDVPTLLSALGY